MTGHLNQLQKPIHMLIPVPHLPFQHRSLTHLALFPPSPSTHFPQIVLLRKNAGSPLGLSIPGAGGEENFEVSSPLTLELAVPPL